jgi:hypothetical protein
MKKLLLGGVIALALSATAVYAYRTVQANVDRGDRPFTFICPLTGKPMCHRSCPAKADAACTEKAEHPSCCVHSAQPNP